jgi:hypothetical protein
MSDKSRRSESTVRAQQEVAASTDYEKRDESAMDMKEEEENIGMEEIEKSETQELDSPHEEHSNPSRLPHAKSLRSIHSHRSYAGGDGYTCFPEQDELPNKSSGDTADGEPFLVTWDGDSDPMNPRSMSKLRRWIIVFIVSASSLCV